MHPFGLYLVATDIQRQHRWGAEYERRASFAKVDALPLTDPEPPSRIARLTSIVRRRVIRPMSV